MSTSEPKGEPKGYRTNYNNCLLFVKRTWPDEDDVTQRIRAEAVHEISKIFFEEILPIETKKMLTPSLN